jgi:hypothetical protein
MRPHDDEIHSMRFGKGEDRVRHRTLLHEALRLDAVFCPRFRELLQTLARVGASLPEDLFEVNRWSEILIGRKIEIDDMT